MNGAHCGNLAGDRRLGEFWEKRFGQLALRYGKSVTAHQIGRQGSAMAWYFQDGERRTLILPDVTVWSFPGQHHEIKHKNPTKKGWFGLEKYRFDSMRFFQNETMQPVFYTIHNHDRSGGRDGMENHLDHWVSASVSILDGSWTHVEDGEDHPSPLNTSYCNGKKIHTTMYYWQSSLFIPLKLILGDEFCDEVYDAHPVQLELEKARQDLRKEQENSARIQRQRNEMMEAYKNSLTPTRRLSPDKNHVLSFAFE
jgi:hypothetical protein